MELPGDHLQTVSICVQLDLMTFPGSNSLDFTSCHVAAILVLAGSVHTLI